MNGIFRLKCNVHHLSIEKVDSNEKMMSSIHENKGRFAENK